jgi:hypothetical protein
MSSKYGLVLEMEMSLKLPGSTFYSNSFARNMKLYLSFDDVLCHKWFSNGLGCCLLQVWFFPFHLLQLGALLGVGCSTSSKLVVAEVQLAFH